MHFMSASLSRLQLVQNAAAHLLTNTNRRVHITPVLNSLHWLPVLYRIDFKLVMFVFKALNSLTPSYLSELLTVHNPGRALRSTNQLLLEVPRSKYKHWGDRAFYVAAPRLWNKLLAEMRLISDLGLFKSRKSILPLSFGSWRVSYLIIGFLPPQINLDIIMSQATNCV